MKSIGENIRIIRESKRISQYAVAYSMDISQAAYSKIERGETEVKASHLYKLAAILGVSIYDLLPPSLASSFDGEDYLLKPIVQWLKKYYYASVEKRRFKKFVV
ncbi:helix-turn-helix domain-containing protein [Pedobacter xixiisoli]|uniref:Helix-turn-helix n=1 Tax=Pedobacter xixiisoli TaxID=1476464 RepID=A0A286ADD1_9SPHI|nr:helix-turn-helix transcriptional regulator [Pedobacter xixiisoli]SOD19885.1 Helix-turn-helix [Pedobacter xixiisoli]